MGTMCVRACVLYGLSPLDHSCYYYTTCLNIKTFAFYPQSVFMFGMILAKTIIFLNVINRFVFITEL